MPDAVRITNGLFKVAKIPDKTAISCEKHLQPVLDLMNININKYKPDK